MYSKQNRAQILLLYCCSSSVYGSTPKRTFFGNIISSAPLSSAKASLNLVCPRSSQQAGEKGGCLHHSLNLSSSTSGKHSASVPRKAEMVASTWNMVEGGMRIMLFAFCSCGSTGGVCSGGFAGASPEPERDKHRRGLLRRERASSILC